MNSPNFRRKHIATGVNSTWYSRTTAGGGNQFKSLFKTTSQSQDAASSECNLAKTMQQPKQSFKNWLSTITAVLPCQGDTHEKLPPSRQSEYSGNFYPPPIACHVQVAVAGCTASAACAPPPARAIFDQGHEQHPCPAYLAPAEVAWAAPRSWLHAYPPFLFSA